MSGAVIKNINDIITDEDGIWVISDDFPCLFRYDYMRQELKLEAVFPEPVQGYAAFSRMVKLENEIYFMPWFAKDIYYYDITSREFYKLDIPFKDFCNDRKTEAVVHGQNLYCINRFPDVVIKINSVTKMVSMFYADMQLYSNLILPCEDWTTYPSPVIYQEKILWVNYKNILTVFDIRSEKFSAEKIDEIFCEKSKRPQYILEDYIIGVRVFKDMLWFFTFDGRVYQYDNTMHKIENKLFDEYAYYDDADNVVVCALYDIVPIDENLYFIPSYKNKCIRYNGRINGYEEILNNYTQNWNKNRRNYTICKRTDDHKILLYSYYENTFYILDTKKNNVFKWKIEDSWIKFAKENSLFLHTVISKQEFDFDDLDWLIQSTLLNDKKETVNLSDGTVGEQIYITLNNLQV